MNKDRLQELLNIPYSELEFDTELKAEITEYYKFIYDVTACLSCKNAFKKYYDKLMVDGIEVLTDKTTNFKLRSDIGVLQIALNDGTFISQKNAPDDICIRFLSFNPNRIELFTKYPENWKELIQNNENETENE
jgi:hypothetical protein